MKNKFLALLSEVKRPGMENLFTWLTDKSDFFTAPASTKYHGAKEGGLVEHSLEVYKNLDRIIKSSIFDMQAVISKDSAIVVALLHDICKANFYTVQMRNAKNEQTGQWEKVPFYAIEDQFPYGHGEKSVLIVREFIQLSVEEMMAIRWHMGAFGSESYAERQALSAAMDKYPLILALQMADLAACYFDKK